MKLSFQDHAFFVDNLMMYLEEGFYFKINSKLVEICY